MAAQADWLLAHRFWARAQAGVAYDIARDRIVVFGGFAPFRALNETWEWDTRGWSHRMPSTNPSPRFLPAMVYDGLRRRVVLFGGDFDGRAAGAPVLGDMWLWDGIDWAPVNGIPLPPPRSAAAIAYDSARQRVVMFGGFTGSARLADTWEWDGSTWLPIAGTPSPSARDSACMTFDSVRSRCVLYGGNQGGTLPRDTWEWDGSTWTQGSPAVAPTADYTAAMAFDTARGRAVLFGGLQQSPFQRLAETWEWNGSSWQSAVPAVRPPAQQYPSVVWHAGLRRTVVLDTEPNSDLWAFDGATWSQLAADDSPVLTARTLAADAASGRLMLFGNGVNGVENWNWRAGRWQRVPSVTAPTNFGVLASDPARQRVVMWSGVPAGQPTWEWNGSDWLAVTTVTTPSPRLSPAMAADPVGGRVLLFGGNVNLQGLVQPTDETWAYDGLNWTLLAPAARPPARMACGMATDVARQRVVMFGGAATSSQVLGDTWEFDGTTWVQASGAGPSARAGATLTFDPVRQRVVQVSAQNGATAANQVETFEWNGASWSQVFTPSLPPAARTAAAFGFDAGSGQLVMNGGLICQGSCAWVSSTWLLGNHIAPQVAPIGAGCGLGAGVPVLGGDEPYLDHSAFRIEVSNATPLAFAVIGVALSPAAVPIGGNCTLYLGGAIDAYWFALDQNGIGRIQLPIPRAPYLLGLTAWAQAAVFDFNPVPTLAGTTAARQYRIGD